MSLKNLIALQKQKRNAPTKAADPASESRAEAESPKPNTPTKPKGLGLNVAGKAKTPPKPAPKPAPKKELDPDSFSLEDIAGLEAAEVAEPESSPVATEFDDEIEATAPHRILDPEITKEMQQFVDSLDGLYQVLHDPEMFGQTVRMIMLELQENNEYEKLLADEDVHVMIRGMRRTMGLARVKKQSKKRGANTKKNARKQAGVSDDVLGMLDSLMGSTADD